MTVVLVRQTKKRAKASSLKNHHNTVHSKGCQIYDVFFFWLVRRKVNLVDSRSHFSSSFIAPWSSLPSVIIISPSISTSSCRLTLTGHPINLFLSGFGKIAIYHNKVLHIGLLALWMMQSSVPQNTLKLRIPSQYPKQPIPAKHRAPHSYRWAAA